jgi:hypothetical protein
VSFKTNQCFLESAIRSPASCLLFVSQHPVCYSFPSILAAIRFLASSVLFVSQHPVAVRFPALCCYHFSHILLPTSLTGHPFQEPGFLPTKGSRVLTSRRISDSLPQEFSDETRDPSPTPSEPTLAMTEIPASYPCDVKKPKAYPLDAQGFPSRHWQENCSNLITYCLNNKVCKTRFSRSCNLVLCLVSRFAEALINISIRQLSGEC